MYACPLVGSAAADRFVLPWFVEIAYVSAEFANPAQSTRGRWIRPYPGSDQMWCAKCQADVSTEVAADGQSINCTSCGSKVRTTQTPSLHPEIQRARQLIEQLSSENPESDSEVSEARSDKPTADATMESPAKRHAVERTTNSESVGPRSFRVDEPHPTERGAHSPPPKTPVASGGPTAPGPQRRDDEPHLTLNASHFDLSTLPRKPNPGKAESIWGQLLAYGGVAVLTVGTALVLWGHFGGPPEYAPTGWLVATAGQMLLFLGVVTLISGGMQQTTHQVTSHVEHIGSRMHRFEQTAEQLLNGPHFGREARATKTTGQSDDAAASS